MNPVTPFSILVVCIGNVCRSPAAERVLRQRLGPTVTAESAGTFGLVGEPISAPVAQLLAERGVNVDGFAARRLSPRADTASRIGASRQQGAPQPRRRSLAGRRRSGERSRSESFPGCSLASTWPPSLPALRPTGCGVALPLAGAQRGRWRVPSREDDILDPYRQPRRCMRRRWGRSCRPSRRLRRWPSTRRGRTDVLIHGVSSRTAVRVSRAAVSGMP
jgi:protein-tyrosine phosphatase